MDWKWLLSFCSRSDDYQIGYDKATEDAERRIRRILSPIDLQPMSRPEIMATIGLETDSRVKAVLALIAGVEADAIDRLASDVRGEEGVMVRGELRACRRIQSLLHAVWDQIDRERKAQEDKAKNGERRSG